MKKVKLPLISKCTKFLHKKQHFKTKLFDMVPPYHIISVPFVVMLTTDIILLNLVLFKCSVNGATISGQSINRSFTEKNAVNCS